MPAGAKAGRVVKPGDEKKGGEAAAVCKPSSGLPKSGLAKKTSSATKPSPPPISDHDEPATLPPTKAETKKPSVSGEGSKKKDANVDMSRPYARNSLKKTRFRHENEFKV